MSRIPISTKTPIKSIQPVPSNGSHTLNRSLTFTMARRPVNSVVNRHPYNPPTTPGRSRYQEEAVASYLSLQEAGEKIEIFNEKYEIDFDLYHLISNTTAEGIFNLLGLIFKKAFIKLSTNINEITLKTINDTFKLYNLPYTFTTRHLMHPSQPEHLHHLMSAIAEFCANRLDPLLQVQTDSQSDIKKEIVPLESIIPNCAAIKAINPIDLCHHARQNQLSPHEVSSVLSRVLNREERQLDSELKELRQLNDECTKAERELAEREVRLSAEPVVYRNDEIYERHMNKLEVEFNQHKATFRLIIKSYQAKAANKIRLHFRSTLEASYKWSKDNSATEYTEILTSLMHTLNEDVINGDAVHGIVSELKQMIGKTEQESKVKDEELEILLNVLRAHLSLENNKMKNQQLLIEKSLLDKELEEVNSLEQQKLELEQKLTDFRR